MAHTRRDKEKLLNRVRRIRGQVEAVERALDREEDCASVLQTIAACRGAINGLMAEVLEGHLRCHVLELGGRKATPEQTTAAEELIEVLKTYLR